MLDAVMGLKARTSTSISIYHYPKCSTCVKARRWLDAKGIHYDLVDIVTSPPTAEEIKAAIEISGLPLSRFFNTSGQSYRQGDFKTKLKSMSTEEAVAALAADGKLIKRPLVIASEFTLVGFKEPEWLEALPT